MNRRSHHLFLSNSLLFPFTAILHVLFSSMRVSAARLIYKRYIDVAAVLLQYLLHSQYSLSLLGSLGRHRQYICSSQTFGIFLPHFNRIEILWEVSRDVLLLSESSTETEVLSRIDIIPSSNRLTRNTVTYKANINEITQFLQSHPHLWFSLRPL